MITLPPNVICFHNPCITCGDNEIVLFDDVEHQMSTGENGTMRAVCSNCGRNTASHLWNEFNPKQNSQAGLTNNSGNETNNSGNNSNDTDTPASV